MKDYPIIQSHVFPPKDISMLGKDEGAFNSVILPLLIIGILIMFIYSLDKWTNEEKEEKKKSEKH